MTTIVDSSFVTQSGYRVNIQLAECKNCAGRIERTNGPSTPGTWGHVRDGLSRCNGLTVRVHAEPR